MMPAEHSHARRRARSHTPTDCRQTARDTGICLWPDCDKPQAGRTTRDYRDVPLCITHIYETWRLARDLATRRDDRTPTHHTVINRSPVTVEKPVSTLGWIYYLRIGDRIKIGHTDNLERRLREYPPNAVVLAVHRGTRSDEKTIHDQLRWYRSHGNEWYEPTAQVEDYIARVLNRYGPPFDPRAATPNRETRPTGDPPIRLRSRHGRR